MKETWISASKVKKMFELSQEKLDELEKNGKVQTMLAVGNRKLYLISSLEASVQKVVNNKNFVKTEAPKQKINFFKKLLLKFFS